MIKENLIKGLVIFGMLVLVGGTICGGFYLNRLINYSLFYETEVKEQMAPLKSKVLDLEKRIEKLEKTK
jgi:hypothetical protein